MLENPAILSSRVGDDIDAVAWFDSVKDAGGPRTATWYMAHLDQTIRNLKYFGGESIWSKLDDLLLYATEDSIQARVSVKRRVTQLIGAGSPVHVPFKHYSFDGASGYLRSGFTPSTDAQSMTGASTFLGVYETVNLAASSVYSAGGINNTSLQGVRITPRSGSNTISIQANSAIFASSGTTISTSIGLCSGQQHDGIFSAWYRGHAAGTATPATSGTTLTTREYYIGCFNNNGNPSGYRAASIGAVVFGAGLTANEHLLLSAILSSHLATMGAIST